MDYSINVNEHNNLRLQEREYWYHAPYANDIIALDSLRTRRKYKFQFSEKGIPDDFVRLCDEDAVNFMKKYRNSHSYIYDICCYTKRHLFASYVSEGRGGHLLVYDMIADKMVFNGIPVFDSQEGTIGDFIAMRMGGRMPLYADSEDSIYGLIPMESLSILDSNEKLKGLLKENLSQNNNPVLFCMKIGKTM